MDRLTRKIDGGYALKLPEDKSISDLEIKFNVYDKLGELEDLAEQGRLFILPCKIGDEVWIVSYRGIEIGKVKEIDIDKDVIIVKCNNTIAYSENICLTKEEAEKKYEKLYGKKANFKKE